MQTWLKDASEAVFAVVEEFVDLILRPEEARSEWTNFYSVMQAEDPLGFEVASNLVDRLSGLCAEGDDAPRQLANQPGKNSALLRQDLADELNLHRLPGRDGVLVVVTTLIDPQKFVQAQVWRGLSDLVDNEKDFWTPFPPPPGDARFGRLARRLTLLKSFCGWLHGAHFAGKQRAGEKPDGQQ